MAFDNTTSDHNQFTTNNRLAPKFGTYINSSRCQNMIRFLIIFISLACVGCSPDRTATAPPNAEYDGAPLTSEFSTRLRQLTSEVGEAFEGHGGLAVAPRGTILLDDRKYQLYGNFMVRDSSMWTSKILEQFWSHLNEHGNAHGFVPQNTESNLIKPTYMAYPGAVNAG